MITTQLNARPLGACGLGVEVTAIQANQATPAEVKALISLLAQYGVVVLRNQNIRPQEYVRFAKLFGEIEPSTREAFWLPENGPTKSS